MERPTAIQARSHRQAMDWSLVLISQGIASTIQEPVGSRWAIEVAEEDFDRAAEAIRQYRLENRRWAWRRELPVPGLLFDWGSLAWVFLITVFYWASVESSVLKQAGIMETGAVTGGDWWRLFTAVWLHGDVAHLASNATIGVVLLGLAMGRYGTGTGLLAAYLAGAGGNLLVLAVITGPRGSLGASGLVMGCVGLLAAQSIVSASATHHRFRPMFIGVAGGIMLFVLLGLGPGTDILAHFGGFVSGLVLGIAVAWAGPKPENSVANVMTGALFAVLTLVPWFLAIKSAR